MDTRDTPGRPDRGRTQSPRTAVALQTTVDPPTHARLEIYRTSLGLSEAAVLRAALILLLDSVERTAP